MNCFRVGLGGSGRGCWPMIKAIMDAFPFYTVQFWYPKFLECGLIHLSDGDQFPKDSKTFLSSPNVSSSSSLSITLEWLWDSYCLDPVIPLGEEKVLLLLFDARHTLTHCLFHLQS